VTQTVAALPPVTDAQKTLILSSPRTTAAHTQRMDEMPAMHVLEMGGRAQGPLPGNFTVAAWNLERCLFPEASAAFLAARAPSLVLLSEMDLGMARTGQRNTTAEIAQALGMTYAYGVEFFELGLGGETEAQLCTDDFNALGFHGNAILSAAPFEDVQLIRLPEEGYWFDAQGGGSVDQPRIGTRMAVAAIIETEAGPLCAVSTHLESNAGAEYRHRQMVALLNAIDDFAPGLPVVLGGDLNTGNHMPPDFDWQHEALFAMAEGRGYAWDASAAGHTTQPSLITPHPKRSMRLDWFALRGASGRAHELTPSVDAAAQPLSDHLCIFADVTLSK